MNIFYHFIFVIYFFNYQSSKESIKEIDILTMASIKKNLDKALEKNNLQDSESDADDESDELENDELENDDDFIKFLR